MGRNNPETGGGNFERPGAREIARLEQRANEANRNVEHAESRVADIRRRAEAARRRASELRARARQTTEQAGTSARQYTEAARRNLDQQRRLREADLPADAPELLRNAGEGARETRGERTRREDREATAAEQRAQMLSVDASLQEAEADSLETELARRVTYYERVRTNAADANYELVAALERSGKREEEIREQLRNMGLPENAREILASLRGGRGTPPQEEAVFEEGTTVVGQRPESQTSPAGAVSFSDEEGHTVTPSRSRRARRASTSSVTPSIQTVAHEEPAERTNRGREPIEFGAGTYRYTVEKGDSLWKIAKKVYGDGNLYTYLRVEGKGDRLPRVIHPGDVIVYRPIMARGANVQIARAETPLRDRGTENIPTILARQQPTESTRPEETPPPEEGGALAGL